MQLAEVHIVKCRIINAHCHNHFYYRSSARQLWPLAIVGVMVGTVAG